MYDEMLLVYTAIGTIDSSDGPLYRAMPLDCTYRFLFSVLGLLVYPSLFYSCDKADCCCCHTYIYKYIYIYIKW